MSQRLTSRRVLARNVLWNSCGTLIPLLAAFVAIPALIASLGTAKFGVLTLVWMVVGYFSLFDLGLGRALTKLVAERLDTERSKDIAPLASNALIFMLGFGLFGAVLLATASQWLVEDLLNIPTALHAETVAATYLLAISIPIVVLSTGLRGIIEAHQRFDLVTYVRLPTGVLTYIAPMVAALYSVKLTVIVMSLLLIRAIAAFIYSLMAINLVPGVKSAKRFDRALQKELLTFGGWMAISNLVGPLLLYLGRIVIAVVLAVEAVAYFATPYEVVAKLLLIPGIFVGVLFPAFSHLFGTNRDRGWRLYKHANLLVAGVMAVPVLAVVIFADWGLSVWINDEFARNGAGVAQLLAVGVFINSFGHIAQASIQGAGRPDWTAKLHLLELILYVPYLWWLTVEFGIVGAALAWVIRMVISTTCLTFLAVRLFKRSQPYKLGLENT